MLGLIFIVILIGFHNSHSDKPQQSLKIQRFTSSVFSPKFPYEKTFSCDWLNRLKHQKKLCLNRKGLDCVLQEARTLAVRECENRFLFDQWNCSTEHTLSKKIYRETAFMQAISASALAYSVAKACSEGRLSGCKCGDPGKVDPKATFQWGGCGHNAKFARRYTRKFLQIKKMDDLASVVMKNNAEVGIKAALVETEKPMCKCHGLSGSCSFKICWRQLRGFNFTSDQLKAMYHKAVKIESKNNYRNEKRKKNKKLLYLEDSPNFCPRTVSRQCKNEDNCATLCCGRGFYSENVRMVGLCNCSWRNHLYQLKCQNCTTEKKIFICT